MLYVYNFNNSKLLNISALEAQYIKYEKKI